MCGRIYCLTFSQIHVRPIKDKALELEMIEKLRAALLEYQAPQEQLIRLGIKENRGETVEETKRYHD